MYHKSGSHSGDQCYHQRNGSRDSPPSSESTKYEMFAADSNVTGCDKCSCNRKVESKSTETDDEQNNTPAGIGFSFAMCHPPLFQEADGFQLLVDSGSSKPCIDSHLIRGVESGILEYSRIEPPMEITAAWNNVLRCTAQGILLFVICGTDDALRTVKLLVVLVPSLKETYFRVRLQLRRARKQSLNRRAHLSILEPSVFS